MKKIEDWAEIMIMNRITYHYLEQLRSCFNNPFVDNPYESYKSSSVISLITTLNYLEKYNAYISEDLYNSFVEKIKNGLVVNGNSSILTLDDVEEYLEGYSKGFQKGYSDYLDKITLKTSIFQDNDRSRAIKISNDIQNLVDYQYDELIIRHNDNDIIELITINDNLYSFGFRCGELYKAFEIVANNQAQFPQFFKESKKNDETKEDNLQELIDIPEIELTTLIEQIRLMYDLGVIEFLQEKYKATLKGNPNQTAILIAQILKRQKDSVQPTMNALLTDMTTSKHYPKVSPKTKAIIDRLDAYESM